MEKPFINQSVHHCTDAVPYPEFARLIGKSSEAVRGMIEKGKLPVVEMTDPLNPSARSEKWVYLRAWNDGLKVAYESRPKEIRDGWLRWLGLEV